MPNMFGGDQLDRVRRAYEEELEAANERRVPRNPPTPTDPSTAAPADRRVRSVVGDYRVVVPNGTQKGHRFFVNNSPVVIEMRGKDATGAEKWDRVTSFPKPGMKDGVDGNVDHALYWLLVGPDAE